MSSEVKIKEVSPLFSIRRLAEYLDCQPDSILEFWHSGRIPPPDVRLSRKAVYWKPETISAFINSGGVR
jgi:hypothetical protein